MNDHDLEAISALLDGAVSEEQAGAIGARLSTDEGLKAHWTRYSLIGDAMRGSLPAYVDPGFAGRVRAALAREPSVAAPQTQLAPAAIAGWPAVALAAGVAAVATIGWLGGQGDAPAAPRSQLAATTASAPVTRAADRQARQAPISRWDDYLVTYSAHRARAGVPTTLPYARIAAYENPR